MKIDDLSHVLQSVLARLQRYREGGVDENISPHDNMFMPNQRDHYFRVGRDAVAIVATAMIKAGITSFGSVVDLPCGSGRVLRHLVRFLPEAFVIASDIDAENVEFCARQFGASPVLSRERFGEVQFARPVDLFWCGSLLTHLSEDRFKDLLHHAVRWLAPGGIAILTLHGRWSMHCQTATAYKYVGDEVFAPIARSVEREGFGYADYSLPDERAGQRSYGLSVSLPSWVMRAVEPLREIRVLDFVERGWDDHQDVLIVRKIPIDGPFELG